MATSANMATLEEQYYEITSLYDFAEELVDTVEEYRGEEADSQLAIVEPLIDEMGDAADILTEEYIALVEHKQTRKPNRKIESALRRIYTAIDAYHKRVQAATSHAGAGVRNLADPIVRKIVRQMEAVVAVLIDLVELSLDRIMTHSYAEELRQRQEKIALMLHSIGQGAT